jgi:hypothetical protein
VNTPHPCTCLTCVDSLSSLSSLWILPTSYIRWIISASYIRWILYQRKSTAVISKTFDPVWNEKFEFKVPAGRETVVYVGIYNKHAGHNVPGLTGFVTVGSKAMVPPQAKVDWWTLYHRHQRKRPSLHSPTSMVKGLLGGSKRKSLDNKTPKLQPLNGTPGATQAIAAEAIAGACVQLCVERNTTNSPAAKMRGQVRISKLRGKMKQAIDALGKKQDSTIVPTTTGLTATKHERLPSQKRAKRGSLKVRRLHVQSV